MVEYNNIFTNIVSKFDFRMDYLFLITLVYTKLLGTKFTFVFSIENC